MQVNILSQQEHSQLTLIVNELLAGLLPFCPWASSVTVQIAEKEQCRLILGCIVEKLRGEGVIQRLFPS